MSTGQNSEPSPVTQEIVAIFDRRLRDLGRTQADLAEVAGVSQSQMSKILRGRKPLDMDLAYMVAADLGLRLLDVIAEAQEVVSAREHVRRGQKA